MALAVIRHLIPPLNVLHRHSRRRGQGTDPPDLLDQLAAFFENPNRAGMPTTLVDYINNEEVGHFAALICIDRSRGWREETGWMPSELYLDRVEFQIGLDERWPSGGWLEVMSVGDLPHGPSMVSTGITGAVGRVLCAEARLIEDSDIPNLWLLMFDFKWEPLEPWEEVRPWTCWTDGRFRRVTNRPDVWRWPVLDELSGEVSDTVCYLDAAPTGVRAVTEGHRHMCDERFRELFAEGLREDA